LSTQTISHRHRARRPARLAGLRRTVRAAIASSARFAARLRTVRPASGTAYADELLRRTDAERPRTLHLGRASIGYYGPTYTAAAPRLHDEVRVCRHMFPAHNGRAGTVVAIISGSSFKPLVVEVPEIGTLYCEANELELIDRPAERTLTMETIEAAIAPERAW
jgi:hypothetical protein